jgi:hypothetical protein
MQAKGVLSTQLTPVLQVSLLSLSLSLSLQLNLQADLVLGFF